MLFKVGHVTDLTAVTLEIKTTNSYDVRGGILWMPSWLWRVMM